MNDHPCTRAFDHQGGTTVPWIIGASIAFYSTCTGNIPSAYPGRQG